MHTYRDISDLAGVVLEVGTLIRVLQPISLIWETVASSGIVVGSNHLEPKVNTLETLLGRKVVYPYIGAELGVYSNTPTGWVPDVQGRACAVLGSKLYTYTGPTTTITSYAGDVVNGDATLLNELASGTDSASVVDMLYKDSIKPLSPSSIAPLIHSLIEDGGLYKQPLVKLSYSTGVTEVTMPVDDLTFELKGSGSAIVYYNAATGFSISNDGLELEAAGATLIIGSGTHIVNAISESPLPDTWISKQGTLNAPGPVKPTSLDDPLLLQKDIEHTSEGAIPHILHPVGQGYYDLSGRAGIQVSVGSSTIASKYPATLEHYSINGVESDPTFLPIQPYKDFSHLEVDAADLEQGYYIARGRPTAPGDVTLSSHVEVFNRIREDVDRVASNIDYIQDISTIEAAGGNVWGAWRYTKDGMYITPEGSHMSLGHTGMMVPVFIKSLHKGMDVWVFDRINKIQKASARTNVGPYQLVQGSVNYVFPDAVVTGVTKDGKASNVFTDADPEGKTQYAVAPVYPAPFIPEDTSRLDIVSNLGIGPGRKIKASNLGEIYREVGSDIATRIVNIRLNKDSQGNVVSRNYIYMSDPYDSSKGMDIALHYPYSAVIDGNYVVIKHATLGTKRRHFGNIPDFGSSLSINASKVFAATAPSRAQFYIGHGDSDAHRWVDIPAGSTIGNTIKVMPDTSVLCSTMRAGKVYSILRSHGTSLTEYILPGGGAPGNIDFAISDDYTKLLYPGESSVRISYKSLGHFK